MINIDDYTVAAQNEADLRDAVSNSTYTYIYLAEDITLTSGMTIYPNKAALTIDGRYPIGGDTIHTFTDMDSTSNANTLGIRESSSINLTIKNMIIRGYNYYGVPYVYPVLTTTTNLIITYENVQYSGPQLTYNLYGTTRYIDCNINIYKTGQSPSQEVGEVNRVEFGGTTNIYHTSDGDDRAVFWFDNNTTTSSITVLEGAVLNINSVNGYFMYNYYVLTELPMAYTLQRGSTFNLETKEGMCYNSSHTVNSFIVNENASFHYTQTANHGTTASLYLDGPLTVGEGASFYMQSEVTTAPLLYFRNGAGRTLTVNNPQSFVLYNASNKALGSGGTNQFTLLVGQLNTWNSATEPISEAGGFTDESDFKWFKTDYANLITFTGTFTNTSTSGTGNLTVDDPPYPPYTSLNFHSSEVISMGDWRIFVNPLTDEGSDITGWAVPGANLKIEYENDGVTHTLYGDANGTGRFSISTAEETPSEILVDTVVSISSNIPFLIKTMTTTVIEGGLFQLESAPTEFEYTAHPVFYNPPILPRTVSNIPVVVKDTRAVITQWELLASIEMPLQSADGNILEDAVVFIENGESDPVTLSNEPYVVYVDNVGEETTEIFWQENTGILVRVTESLSSGVAYTTIITWDLRII